MVSKEVLRARFGRESVVRRSVGAPTAHACPGNGSHHPENISAGRGGPRGELSWPHVGTASWCCRRGAASEQPLWLDPRNTLLRPDLVCRGGNPRLGPHPAGGVARVTAQGAKRLRLEHRPGGDQRDCGNGFAGTRSL